MVVAGTRRDDLPRVEIELALTSQHMIGRGTSRDYSGFMHRWDHPAPASRVVHYPAMPQTGLGAQSALAGFPGGACLVRTRLRWRA